MNFFLILILASCILLVLAEFVKGRLIKNFTRAVSILIYTSLIAFKGGSGADTSLYIRLFEHNLSFVEVFYSFSDFAFVLLFASLSDAGFSFYSLNYINAILAFFSLYYIATKKNGYLVVLYISFIGINVDFSTLRQSISIHVFSIVYFYFNSQFLAVIVAVGFHKSAIFAYLNKLKDKKITKIQFFYLVLLLTFFYYFFLVRYLQYGTSFLYRDSYLFLFQSLIVCFFMYMLKFRGISIVFVFFLFFLPIGFRLIFFTLIMDRSSLPNVKFNKLALGGLLLVFTLSKLYSFTSQSISINGDRSVVNHYMVN